MQAGERMLFAGVRLGSGNLLGGRAGAGKAGVMCSLYSLNHEFLFCIPSLYYYISQLKCKEREGHSWPLEFLGEKAIKTHIRWHCSWVLDLEAQEPAFEWVLLGSEEEPWLGICVLKAWEERAPGY